MKRRYKIDYDQKVDCFAQIRHIKSDLIYGDLDYIKNPYISYIIPVYKRADLLAETLDSVLQQKKVDFPWDIVVVDNEAGAENETERLVRKIDDPRILYYRNQENIGVDGNYNRCIELARGEWVAMIHGDDLIVNDHLLEMGRLIKEMEPKDKTIAYICQRYGDFSSADEVSLVRPHNPQTPFEHLICAEYNKGKLFHEKQIHGIVTGFFAAIPSFGTMMKREIMILFGGFNKDLGICEDVITPYKLAKKHGVYLAPKLMGFHRFEENESMKIDTILKIYASMIDFREYMYSRNFLTRMWGFIARDMVNKDLRNYCIGMSRFNPKRLRNEDFDPIYKVKPVGKIKNFIYKIGRTLFNQIYGITSYEEMVARLLAIQDKKISKSLSDGNDFIIYGAGKVTEAALPYLKNKYKRMHILACAVSDRENAQGEINGIPIKLLEDIECTKEKTTVIISTITWEFKFEMDERALKNGFKSVIDIIY